MEIIKSIIAPSVVFTHSRVHAFISVINTVQIFIFYIWFFNYRYIS